MNSVIPAPRMSVRNSTRLRGELPQQRCDGERGSGLELGRVDLGDALVALSDAGLAGAEREGITVCPVEHDAAALLFDPI